MAFEHLPDRIAVADARAKRRGQPSTCFRETTSIPRAMVTQLRKSARLDETKPQDPALGLLRVLRDDGTADPESDPLLPGEVLRRIYREMKRLRLLDERMILMQRQGRVGFYGACTGQEAVPIATGFALSPQDWVFPALRESAIMLVRGFPLSTYLAQVYGNALDVLKGRQMPSHMSGRGGEPSLVVELHRFARSASARAVRGLARKRARQSVC